MHAVLLTLIALGGGVDGYEGGRITQSSAGIYDAAPVGGDYGGGDCAGGNCGGHFNKGNKYCWFGPMPQTCYSPRYGCYYGGNRHMHRYPAFHGTYYRRPYNYRNVFEYPWHAEMHEPTSMFSYNTVGEEAGPAGAPVPGVGVGPLVPPTPPALIPDSARRSNRPNVMPASAYRPDATHPGAKPAATLRR
jgi:hypothetical protein